MISDHVAVTRTCTLGYPAPFHDPLPASSAWPQMTNEVEIGTTVIVIPYRDPLLVARMGATLDQLSLSLAPL